MAKQGRIKARPNKPASGRVTAQDSPPNYDSKPPIFSLERLQDSKYCLSKLDKDHKASFSDAIFKRKDLSWAEIKKINKHGLGFEKIATSAIRPGIPTFITEDAENLLAFRYCGMNPMVGYRVKDIFYVLWFDHDFTLYIHG